MARRRKPQDPTYALIEQMVEQSGLNATTQEEVMDFSKMFMKAFLERSLNGEMNHFLKEEATVQESSQEPAEDLATEDEGVHHNSRNGFSKKTVSTKAGKVTIDLPRDRRGRFLPGIVPKHAGVLKASTVKLSVSMPRGCPPGIYRHIFMRSTVPTSAQS